MAVVVNFGCRLNQHEADAMLKKSEKAGLSDDYFILNSCAVTESAEKDLTKKIRRIRRENPNSKIIVTGCSAQANPERYSSMGSVDYVIGNKSKLDGDVYEKIATGTLEEREIEVNTHSRDLRHEDKIFYSRKAGAVAEVSAGSVEADGWKPPFMFMDDIMQRDTPLPLIYDRDVNSVNAWDGEFQVPEAGSGANSAGMDGDTSRDAGGELRRARAFLEVQVGCNHRCTFCIIPYGRGNSRSVPLGSLADEVRRLVDVGYNEIVLTGVDVTSYGNDLPGDMTLGKMMKRLLGLVPNLNRLRLSSVDVAEVDDDMLELLDKGGDARFMPYFHLSLQSGDDLILKRMKRRHNRKQVFDFLERVRGIRSDVGIGADIIAGFPTEEDEHFANTLSIVRDGEIPFCHIFSFSPRSGTPAALMPYVERSLIKSRARILIEEGKVQLKKFLEGMVGTTQKVIVESSGGVFDGLTVRCENFCEGVMDGVHLGRVGPAGGSGFKLEDTKFERGDICKVVVKGVAEGGKRLLVQFCGV